MRLQDKLGKKNYKENAKKFHKQLTDALKDTSRDITKTITKTYIKNNKATSDLNEKVLKLLEDIGMIAPYLAPCLVILFKPEDKSQFKLIKDPNSIRMNDFLISVGIIVTLYSNMLTFKDSNTSVKLDGDLLETMTNYDFNVGQSNPQYQNLI